MASIASYACRRSRRSVSQPCGDASATSKLFPQSAGGFSPRKRRAVSARAKRRWATCAATDLAPGTGEAIACCAVNGSIVPNTALCGVPSVIQHIPGVTSPSNVSRNWSISTGTVSMFMRKTLPDDRLFGRDQISPTLQLQHRVTHLIRPHDADANAAAVGEVLHQRGESLQVRHGVSAELDDHVAGLKARLLGGPVAEDLSDEQSLLHAQPVSLGEQRRERLDDQAEPLPRLHDRIGLRDRLWCDALGLARSGDNRQRLVSRLTQKDRIGIHDVAR